MNLTNSANKSRKGINIFRNDFDQNHLQLNKTIGYYNTHTIPVKIWQYHTVTYNVDMSLLTNK